MNNFPDFVFESILSLNWQRAITCELLLLPIVAVAMKQSDLDFFLLRLPLLTELALISSLAILPESRLIEIPPLGIFITPFNSHENKLLYLP